MPLCRNVIGHAVCRGRNERHAANWVLNQPGRERAGPVVTRFAVRVWTGNDASRTHVHVCLKALQCIC